MAKEQINQSTQGNMSKAALTTCRLAWYNLKRKPVRSALLVSISALFAFALFTGIILNTSLSRGFSSLSARLGGDILLVPYGYEKNMQAALLRGESSQFYFKADLAEKVRAFPGVAAASPQLFFASLSSGCCSVKVQLIGYDPDTDFVVTPWMSQQLDRKLGTNEVVAGSLILPEAGEMIRFFNQNFTIAAKMERTGMGFDSSVFMSMDSVRELMNNSDSFTGDINSINEIASSIVVKVREGEDVKSVANALMHSFAIEYNLDFIVATGLISDISASMGSIDIILFLMAALLWGISLITLLLVFSSILNERKRELAIMRILGASIKKLSRVFVCEIMYICTSGGILGLLAAAFFILPFIPFLFTSFGLPYLSTGISEILFTALLVLALALVTGIIASGWTIYSLARRDIYSTLREGE